MIKEIMKLSGETGKDPATIFKDLLRYTVGFFTADGSEETVASWAYSKEDNRKFLGLMRQVMQEYDSGIRSHGWADPWGECYEALASKTKASSFGQFFTPRGMCDFVSEIVAADASKLPGKNDCGAFGRRVVVSDPSCGSGRNLLAVASRFTGRPRKDLPFFVGEDIDETCCAMTAANLMAHGLPGEVICHNTLSEPSGCKFGYVINEGMYPLPGGIPTIRRFSDPSRFVTLRGRG